MKTEELIQSIKQRDPILAKAVSGMIDYIQDSGQHPIRPKSRRKRSMPTYVPSILTVTEQ